MSVMCDLTSLDLKVGNYSERPDAPTSIKHAFWARDTRQLFIASYDNTWRDVGLFRYTVIDQPTLVTDGAQITWSNKVTVMDEGAIQFSGDGAIYVVG